MRLLTPTEHEVAIEKEKTAEEKELIDLSAFINEETRRLNQQKADMANEREILTREHRLFIEEQEGVRSNLMHDVERLQLEKKEAAEPLTALENRLEKKNLDLIAYGSRLKILQDSLLAKEIEVDSLREQYENKIDSLMERMSDVKAREEQLYRSEKIFREMSHESNKDFAERTSLLNEKSVSISNKEHELILRESSAESILKSISEREQGIDQQKKFIKSQYSALEAAIAEAKTKGIEIHG